MKNRIEFVESRQEKKLNRIKKNEEKKMYP